MFERQLFPKPQAQLSPTPTTTTPTTITAADAARASCYTKRQDEEGKQKKKTHGQHALNTHRPKRNNDD